MPLHIIKKKKKMHGMGHLLEIIHGLPQAKTGSFMLYFLYVVASLKTPLEILILSCRSSCFGLVHWYIFVTYDAYFLLTHVLTHFTANYC
jgi:hypothetical protein